MQVGEKFVVHELPRAESSVIGFAAAAKAVWVGPVLPPVWLSQRWRERDTECVGFVGFDRSRDPKTPSTTGEIWALHIKPEHWGRGVGVALWDAAREGLEDEGCTTVTLWVPLRNDRAMRFFELAGFKREMKTAKTTALGTVKIEEIRLKRSVV